MATPQFFDIDSSQFQEVTNPTGNEEIQVGATQKVKLKTIAALLDLAEKTLEGITIPTSTSTSAPVASTDNLLSALSKILAVSANGLYHVLIADNVGTGSLILQKAICIYAYNTTVGPNSFNSLTIGQKDNVWYLGTKSKGLNPSSFSTDKAIFDAIVDGTNPFTALDFGEFQKKPLNPPAYIITTDSTNVPLEINGNSNYVIQKSNSVNITTDKNFTLDSTKFGSGKENTIVYIPTNLVNSSINIGFIPNGSEVLFAGPGFSKDGTKVTTELNPSLGTVLVIAIQEISGVGFVFNSAYYV